MNTLQVSAPYFCQLSTRSGEGQSMCFSACNAMLVATLHSTALAGTGLPEDIYLMEVERHGDSTDPLAQEKALTHFGVKADEKTDCTWSEVDAQLAKGIPVPMGILHHGPVSAPTGRGHWILCIGRTTDGCHLYHDPYGSLDVVNGGYPQPGMGGMGVRYTDSNLGHRWSPEGPGHGWAMIASKT